MLSIAMPAATAPSHDQYSDTRQMTAANQSSSSETDENAGRHGIEARHEKRFGIASIAKMIGIAALVITALIIVSVLSKVDDWGRDFTENRAETSFSRSDWTPQEATDAIVNWVDEQPRWNVESQQVESQQDATKLHLTRSTAVMKFTDDVHLTIRAAAGGVQIDAVSQSRIGKGDLGQNPRNLAELAQLLQH